MSLERLATEPNLWLATVRPDDRPHLVPVWFVFVDGRVWIGTGARSVKVRNLAANPAVSLSLESGSRPVVAEGVARVVPRPYPDAVVTAFRAKYDWDVTVDDDADVGPLALVAIDVGRWVLGSAEPEGGPATV